MLLRRSSSVPEEGNYFVVGKIRQVQYYRYGTKAGKSCVQRTPRDHSSRVEDGAVCWWGSTSVACRLWAG